MNSQADLIADLKTLNQISQTLNQAVDVESALNEALAKLVDLMGLDTGWIFLRDEAAVDPWWGKGYVLATQTNLPPAMDLANPKAWKNGCDCQGFCNKGKLTEAYNEVRCSRLTELQGDKRGLLVHASAPLRSGENVLGILNVAASEWESFTPRALALLSNVGAQMGAALERAHLYDLLRAQRLHEQSALLDLSNQLLSRSDLDDLMQYLVDQVKVLLQANAVALLLPGEEPGELVFGAVSDRPTGSVVKKRAMRVDEGSEPNRVMQTRRPMIMNWLGTERVPDWLAAWLPAEGILTTAIVPLVADERSIGTLVVNSLERRRFDENDIRFLQLMANQAAIAIEKARLHHQELIQQRLEEELAVGRQIQLSLLPKSCPTKPGWEFCDIYRAARQVGGDLYDFFDLPGEGKRLGLVIGDVSDKGVPAALFMGVSRSLIRSAAFSGRNPAAALNQANRLIQRESQSGLFLSAFYGILDIDSGRLTYANAGHNPPLLFRPARGKFQELTADGIVLCVLEEIDLEEKQIDLSSGDVLIFYTDGVTEAMNATFDEFGVERLQAAVVTSADGRATYILQTILDAVSAFTGGTDQSDDLSLFVVKRI